MLPPNTLFTCMCQCGCVAVVVLFFVHKFIVSMDFLVENRAGKQSSEKITDSLR